MRTRLLSYSTAVMMAIASLVSPAHAEEVIGYGGLYTSTSSSTPLFDRNRATLTAKIRHILEQSSSEGKLPFKILFETDTEEVKRLIPDDTYSLAVLITRDDVITEGLNSEKAQVKIDKSYVNVGMVVMLYQTDSNAKRNSIVYSFPLVGYAMHVSGNQPLSTEKLDQLFINVATETFAKELVNRLQDISLGKITGAVKGISGNSFAIAKGGVDGLTEGQKVTIRGSSGNQTLTGRIETLSPREATVIVKAIDPRLSGKLSFEAVNIKSLSDETYQVTAFDVSSKKCQQLLDVPRISAQASQWFSDFLSSRGGRVVLPTSVGANWVESANEQSYAVFLKDGQEHTFEMPKPKYEVKLNLSGFSSMKIKEASSDINENWLYKIWLDVEIPEKKFTQKFELVDTKSLITGGQTFDVSNQIFEMLHQLTAKAAREIE